MTDEEKKAADKLEAEKKEESERLAKEKADLEAKGNDNSIPYERFKSVVDEKNKLKSQIEKGEQEKQEADKKKLEEQGKFQEAAELADKRAKEAEEKAEKAEAEKKQKSIEFEIGLEAKNQGINDIKDATKLIDLTKIDISDTGEITGVKESIEELKKGKPYLFGNEKIGVHTDHAKGASEMTREELLKDPMAMMELKTKDLATYNKVMGK